MNPLSIPAIVMASITFYVGMYHFIIFNRRRQRHQEDLTFSITCFLMVIYDLLCVFVYHVHSVKSGFLLQRAQVATISLVGVSFIWFTIDYLKYPSKKGRNIFSLYLFIASFIVMFDRSPLSWKIDKPAVKSISLPWNFQVTYFEVEPGLLTEFLGIMGCMIFCYILWMCITSYKARPHVTSKSLFLSVFIFFIGFGNDAAIHSGFYKFVYSVEFAYMGIVLLMTFSLSRPVIESAEMKEALEESEHRYRDLIENMNVGIFIIQDDVITFCNDRFAEILGYQGKEMIIDNPVKELIVAKHLEQVLKDSPAELSENQYGNHYDFTLINRNNRNLYVEGFAGRIWYKNKPAIQGAIIDITVRKKAEEQLQQTALTLKHYNAEMEEFASVISHDLQEPLRTVASFVQLLARRYKNKLNKEATEFIDFAVSGVQKLHRLINDFMRYTQLGTGKRKMEMCDIEEILVNVFFGLGNLIDDHHTKITNDPLPKVIMNHEELIQVFRNLIENAIQFCDQKTPKIHITSVKMQSEKCFSISDNGMGIDPQFYEKIFGVFERLIPNEKDKHTGIGLAICRKIIERRGGRIWIESEVNKGSRFYFTIPD